MNQSELIFEKSELKVAGLEQVNPRPDRVRKLEAPSKNVGERLWKRIDVKEADLCWPWKGHVNEWGYGSISYKGKTWGTHRLAYMLKNGPVPDGLFVCHTCDNPRCCNPSHLWLGTAKDNFHDAVKKSRNTLKICKPGEGNGHHKLTTDQVIEIRRSYPHSGKTMKQIGIEYGVSRDAIFDVIRRRKWKHV